MGEFIEIKDSKKHYGKLWVTDKPDAPLLIVFGGKPVGGRKSGDYMWDFMNGFKETLHIFVADTNFADGNDAYNALMKLLPKETTPSQQILYLFSGGGRPGMELLRSIRSKGSDPFSSIFLMDIYLGDTDLGKFYEHLVNKSDAKIAAYVYTKYGPGDDDAAHYIAKKLGAKRAIFVAYQKGVDHTDTHVSTNKVGVDMLK